MRFVHLTLEYRSTRCRFDVARPANNSSGSGVIVRTRTFFIVYTRVGATVTGTSNAIHGMFNRSALIGRHLLLQRSFSFFNPFAAAATHVRRDRCGLGRVSEAAEGRQRLPKCQRLEQGKCYVSIKLQQKSERGHLTCDASHFTAFPPGTKLPICLVCACHGSEYPTRQHRTHDVAGWPPGNDC